MVACIVASVSFTGCYLFFDQITATVKGGEDSGAKTKAKARALDNFADNSNWPPKSAASTKGGDEFPQIVDWINENGLKDKNVSPAEGGSAEFKYLLAKLQSPNAHASRAAFEVFALACEGHPGDIDTEPGSLPYAIDDALFKWHRLLEMSTAHHLTGNSAIGSVVAEVIPYLESESTRERGRNILNNFTFMLYDEKPDSWWINEGFSASDLAARIKPMDVPEVKSIYNK